MRVTVLAALVLALPAAHAKEARLYFGTYTRAPSSGQGIYTTTLDTETGKLGPISLAVKTRNPSFVTVASGGKFAYAALEEKNGEVASFAIQPDGSLTPLNTQSSGGKAACHVSLDSANRHVLAANYGSGDIACFPIQPDGSLGAQTDYKAFVTSGSNSTNQSSKAHAIQTDPEDHFVYVCDLGLDKIWIFAFDKTKGALTPTEPPFASVPPGSGPRHLAFHPDGRFAYVTNEKGLSVTAFSRDHKTGSLTPLQTIPTLPTEKIEPTFTTAEIICHPSGRWLYVSNRLADLITLFSIGRDGLLTFVENFPALVHAPRGMALDPTSHWLVTAGQYNAKVAVLEVDQKTGALSSTGQSAEIPSPVSVIFVP